MHILLIHQVFVRPEDHGGTRHYDFARHMVQNGHRVTVLAGTRSYLTGARLKAAPHENPVPGLEIVRCGVIGGGRRGFAWRTVGYFSFILTSLLRGIRIRGVHVVWGTSPPLFQGWTAWLLARLKRTPWLFEVRDLWPEFAIQIGALRSRTLIALSRWLERSGSSASKFVRAPASGHGKDDLCRPLFRTAGGRGTQFAGRGSLERWYR